MARLLGLGLLAAALFSVTFILNRSMSLSGGHWAWSASLRYLDTAALLMLWIVLRHGVPYLAALLRLFRRQLGFWLVAGSIGGGVFYGSICYAAGHAPAWVVAATWQVTVLATPLVLRLLRRARAAARDRVLGADLPRRGGDQRAARGRRRRR